MLLQSSRTQWELYPLLFSILALCSCSTYTFSPSGGNSTSPSASASISALAKSSAMTSFSPQSTEKIAMGTKPQDGECPKSEPIKGEIGEHKKVYHLPDSKDYAKIKPATCFTSVTEAKKAGFRAPRNISEILKDHLKDGKF